MAIKVNLIDYLVLKVTFQAGNPHLVFPFNVPLPFTHQGVFDLAFKLPKSLMVKGSHNLPISHFPGVLGLTDRQVNMDVVCIQVDVTPPEGIGAIQLLVS